MNTSLCIGGLTQPFLQQIFVKPSARYLALALLLALFAAPLASASTPISQDTVLKQNIIGGVVIGADDISLDCNGFAINGAPIPPSQGISLNSRSGIVIKNCTINGFFNGISATAGSSLTLENTTIRGAALSGLEAFDNSHVTITGDFSVQDVGLSGMFLINSVSVTMVSATVILERNAVGINLGLNSSIFVNANPPLPPSSITAQDNSSFGLSSVSNSEVFLFGNVQVVSRRNGSNGFSIFSKSALELDNGASLTVEDNAGNGVTLEDSTINMFNMTQFKGSNIISRGNGEAGLNLSKASVFDMGGEAKMTLENNPVGLALDDGSSAKVQNAVIANNGKDAVLSFGSRAEFTGNTIGSKLLCDRSVLVRGDERCRRFKNEHFE